jgi:cytochrome bd-type quinol oxidase subunit 2
LIGWIFSVASGIALALGIVIIGLNYSRDETRGPARKRVLEDAVLSCIWLLGLAGGVGVLHGKAWSRPALEFFCWTLMVLLLMSCWSWLRATPPPRNMRAIQMALFVMPVVAICIATILTLRSETALRVLSG